MATNVMVEIICDDCNESETEWNITKASFRHTLKADGWKFTPRADICPRCAQEVAR